MQHTAAHCDTLQHTASHQLFGEKHQSLSRCNTAQHTAPPCNTLQHTAAHCITPAFLESNTSLSCARWRAFGDRTSPPTDFISFLYLIIFLFSTPRGAGFVPQIFVILNFLYFFVLQRDLTRFGDGILIKKGVNYSHFVKEICFIVP